MVTAIKASTLYDFTQPEMRAVLAGHRAALSLLTHKQLDMAFILQHSAGVDQIALLPTVAASSLSWDDGLAPLADSLADFSSGTSKAGMFPPWDLLWPNFTVAQAEWYCEWQGEDLDCMCITNLPTIHATRLLTHIGMPQKVMHLVRIPGKADPTRRFSWPAADLQDQQVMQLQKSVLPATSEHLTEYLAAQFGISHEDANFQIRYLHSLNVTVSSSSIITLVQWPGQQSDLYM